MKLLKTHLSRSPNEWSYPLTAFVLMVFLGLSLLFWTQPAQMAPFTAARDAVYGQGQYWRLFTAIALHADIQHFLSNSIFFFIFGFLLHSYFGLWVFPTLSLILGAAANYLTLYYYPAHSVLIGASGVVYFMAGLWATLFFFIERKDRALKRLGVTICVTTMLFFPTTYEPQTSYLAHAWGFFLGIGSGIVYFYLNRTRLRQAEVWKAPEIYEDPQLSADFDQLSESLDHSSHDRAV